MRYLVWTKEHPWLACWPGFFIGLFGALAGYSLLACLAVCFVFAVVQTAAQCHVGLCKK